MPKVIVNTAEFSLYATFAISYTYICLMSVCQSVCAGVCACVGEFIRACACSAL